MKITDYIGETTEYDKKAMLEERKPKSWLKSVSAFANGVGGVLIFGIADDDTVVGLSDSKYDSERISELIKSKMDPIPPINMRIHCEDGKKFIILKVSSGQETPYYYYSDGNRIAYIRVGNESVPADAIALKRLVLQGTSLTYDSMESSYHFDKFSFTKLRTVYRLQTGFEFLDSDFLSFELVNENKYLTNAGALLADESPIRQSRLFCTRWYGLDKASGVMDALDDKEYSGSLISLLQNGNEFVKNNSKKRWKKTGSGRIEMPDYPEQAVHEAIVNALIHRDYTETGSEVHIDIFDDRLEIYSPGGMPDGSIVQNLDMDNVSSKRRNPVIADLFSRMHFMERRGSGFKKIKADYHNAVNYSDKIEPVFRSTPTSFFVTLFNLNYKVPFGDEDIDNTKSSKTNHSNEKQDIEHSKTGHSNKKQDIELQISNLEISQPTKDNILILLNAFGFDIVFSRADIMSVTHLTASPSSTLIRKLKEYGLIESVKGQGKGKYKFKN